MQFDEYFESIKFLLTFRNFLHTWMNCPLKEFLSLQKEASSDSLKFLFDNSFLEQN